VTGKWANLPVLGESGVLAGCRGPGRVFQLGWGV